MALELPQLVNSVEVASTTTGTGTLTLGSAATRRAGTSALTDGHAYAYRIDHASANEWELGIGVYTASGTTLTRATIITGSNGTSAVNLSSGDKSVKITVPAEMIDVPIVNDFRLTTESGVPLPLSDRTAQGTIYLVSTGRGNRITVPIGAGKGLQVRRVDTPPSLGLSGLTSGSLYDLFVWDNAGTLTLAAGTAWTSATARVSGSAGELTTLDGLYVNKYAEGSIPAKGGLYVGTFRASGTGTTEQAFAKQFLWNFYNQVRVRLNKAGPSGYTCSATSWRQANADSTAQVEFVTGFAGNIFIAYSLQLTVGGNNYYGNVALDGTSSSGQQLVPSLFGHGGTGLATVPSNTAIVAPQIGYHYLAMVEVAGASGSTIYDTGLRGDYMG